MGIVCRNDLFKLDYHARARKHNVGSIYRTSYSNYRSIAKYGRFVLRCGFLPEAGDWGVRT